MRIPVTLLMLLVVAAAGPQHQAWLDQDAAYIITDEERKAFNQLQTDEERDQFIEQFWKLRGAAFKQEHYRRIAYANEHYASNIPGWKTDRGRIYIMYGPPDQIESHPNGGAYARPPEEGGGTTDTYPFEQWRYRYIEDVGSDIIIEFVDPTMTGEYRMTMDPTEKDALLYVPNAGLTPMEQMGLASATTTFHPDGADLTNGFESLQHPGTLRKPPLEPPAASPETSADTEIEPPIGIVLLPPVRRRTIRLTITRDARGRAASAVIVQTW